MDEKLRETTDLGVETNEQQTTSKEETCSRGTNSFLPLIWRKHDAYHVK